MSRDADRGSPGGARASAGGGSEREAGRDIKLPDSWDLPRAAAEAPRAEVRGDAVSPHHRRPPYLFLVVGVAAVMIATVAAAAIAWQLTDTPAASTDVPEERVATATPSPQPAHTTQTTSASAAAEASAAKASAAAEASATASASASAAPAAARHESPGACFASLLPPGALGEPAPKLEACCTGEDGYKTMLKLKAALVRVGGGNITPAMSEWSVLGWHETAAFAIMRAHCCPDAPALRVSESLSKCRMDEALAYLVNGLDDESKMTEALEAYRAAAKCLAGSGWGGSFNQYGYPHDGELASLKRVLGRLQQARRR